MIFFTADTHFNHGGKKGGIIKYCNRPFNSVTEMNEILIENWNKKVKNSDLVYVLGDFVFGNRDAYNNIRNKLNGKIVLIIGDHDRNIGNPKDFGLVMKTPYFLLKKNKQNIVLFHWCIRTWQKSHYNSSHAFGHCLDDKTEILTYDGWKFRNKLKKSDSVLTLDLNDNKLKYNNIDEIVDYDYSGNVYNLKTKVLDFRVTENHVLIDVKIGSKKFRKFFAKDLILLNRRRFIKSGNMNNFGINLRNNYIKLLVWIAADGNLCNIDLVRIGISKLRKINRIRYLLNKLNIEYRELPQKNGRVSFNFTVPNELKDYKLKPIDKKIEFLNKEQLKILLEEYINIDGNKVGSTYLIYTSKKPEADSIQIACVKNGYSCNISERKNHGFSKKPSYTLIITNRQYKDCTNIKKILKIEKVKNEHFWCVKVLNKNICIRRNGRTLFVGNSHGKLVPIGKSWDVGVDNNDFYPVSFDEFVSIMDKRPNNINYISPKERRFKC